MSKSITKNAFFNITYKALSVVFPLITISYASRIFGASGIGAVSSAQNIVTYFIIFAALGIPSYGVRAIAQKKSSKIECDNTFTELFIINFLSTVVCALAYFILINTFSGFLESKSLNIVFGSLIIMSIFNVEWVYQGFEEYKYIAIRSLLIKGISLLLLVLFVKTPSDLLIFSAIVCFGTVGNYLLNIIQLRKFVSLNFKDLRLRRHLKAIMVFFGSVIAIEVYSLLGVTMLTQMTNYAHVGYYSNAEKIIRMLANTFTSIGAVLLPRLSLYYYEKKNDEIEKVIRKFLHIIILLSVPSCVGLILVADKIVPILFGNDFLPAISTLRILSPSMILLPLSGGVFGQLLLTTHKEHSYLKCVFIGAVTNVVLNVILIPIWSQNGAAVACIITEGIVNGFMIMACRKIARVGLERKEILRIGTAVVIMAILVCVISPFLKGYSIVLALIIEVLAGIFAYFATLVVMKDDMVLRMGKTVVQRMSGFKE